MEPLDEVRFLTNHSTGQLGSSLADALIKSGHETTLLLSESARNLPNSTKVNIHPFNSTNSLKTEIKNLSNGNISAVFHVAAVSDFTPKASVKGKINSSKNVSISLNPTPKIINQLREWYPTALLFGWKYDVEGDQDSLIKRGFEQITRCRTDYCVLNGSAYGTGFGLLQRELVHCPSQRDLIRSLLTSLQ